jgi:hypothetical protein
MMTVEKFKSIIFQLIIILLCLCVSFINYCVVQITPLFILPMTIVPIVAYSLFSNRAPSLTIAVVTGIVDDTILNTHLGVFPLAYIVLMYVPQYWKQSATIKRIVFFIFLVIFIIVNILYYHYFPSTLHRQ